MDPPKDRKKDKQSKNKKPPVQSKPQEDDDYEDVEDEEELDRMIAEKEKERKRLGEKEFEDKMAKAEEELAKFVENEAKRIWTALQSDDDRQYAQMGIDREGAERMKAMGAEKIKEQFYKHTRAIWEQEGKILPPKKQSSFWGNICCWIFMIIFFVFLIFSKMNEETLSLFGMNSTDKFVDHYETLQLSPGATAQDIKRQYRKLANQYHPDKNKGDEAARQRFLLISEANEVLSDPRKRQIYDQSSGMGSSRSTIPSKTTTLTNQNYDRLTRTGEFWVIQVFDHDSGHCQSFSDTWERMAQKYTFLRFGRIDYKTQQKLIPRLPFRPMEFPFLFTTHPQSTPEFVEHTSKDIGTKLLETIKASIPAKVQLLSVSEFTDIIQQGSTQPYLIFLNRRGFDDILFLFESRLMTGVNYASTHADKYGLIKEWANKNGVKLPDKYLLVYPKGHEPRMESLPDGYLAVSQRLRVLFPPSLNADSVRHFCPTSTEEDLSKERICLLSFTTEGQAVMKSIREELESSPLDEQTAARVNIAQVDLKSQPLLEKLALKLRGGAELKDSMFVIGADSNRIALVKNVRQFIQVSGLEGLVDEATQVLSQKGVYPSEYYPKLSHVYELFKSEDSSFFSLLLGYLYAESFTLFFGLVGIFLATLVVKQLRHMRSPAIVTCILYSLGRVGYYLYQERIKENMRD